MTRHRRTFTTDFKLKMVTLYENGQSRKEIIHSYDLTPSALDNWIKSYKKKGSFITMDSRTKEEIEISELYKQNKYLMMENDILKQCTLIMGRKSM